MTRCGTFPGLAGKSSGGGITAYAVRTGIPARRDAGQHRDRLVRRILPRSAAVRWRFLVARGAGCVTLSGVAGAGRKMGGHAGGLQRFYGPGMLETIIQRKLEGGSI